MAMVEIGGVSGLSGVSGVFKRVTFCPPPGVIFSRNEARAFLVPFASASTSVRLVVDTNVYPVISYLLLPWASPELGGGVGPVTEGGGIDDLELFKLKQG